MESEPRLSSDDDPPESDPYPHITAVVLAAGEGRRLASDLPKPAFPICGRAMSAHVLHALSAAGVRRAVAVVAPNDRGHAVREALAGDPAELNLAYVVQTNPRGTADAVLAAREQVSTSHLLVVNGDLPLITPEQISPLLRLPDADAIIATARVSEPAKMGRIVRAQCGSLAGIVEWEDASEKQRHDNEVNLGIYLFRSDFLWPELERIVAASSRTGEAYATDAIPPAVQLGRAAAVEVPLTNGRMNVETPADAANAEALIRRRIVEGHLHAGVHIRDPHAVWIDAQATIAPRAVIEPGVHILGQSTIDASAHIGPNAVIEDSSIGERCTIESCTIRGSTLSRDVEVGPYSTIRPGCEIGPNAHIGTHAELKQARIGDGVQIGHFSYLGDVEVGARSNIGAGAITCNFDGVSKHRTIIGDDAFIGSDSMLVAPLRVGDRARTGAGSVVTKDVPDDASALGHPARLAQSRAGRRASEPMP